MHVGSSKWPLVPSDTGLSSRCGVFNAGDISKGFKNSHSGLNPSQNLSLYLAWKEKH